MVSLIVNVAKDYEKRLFVKVENDNLILVEDIRLASKFSPVSDNLDKYLTKARETFNQHRFVVTGVPKLIFVKPITTLL